MTIGNSVESILNLAFDGAGLESVTIPASVTQIEYSAFERNEDLTRVTFLGDYYSGIRQSIFSDIDANQLTICTLEGASGWEGKYFFYSPYPIRNGLYDHM